MIDVVANVGKRKRKFRATSAPLASFPESRRIVMRGHSGATSTMNRTVSEVRTHELKCTGYVGISLGLALIDAGREQESSAGFAMSKAERIFVVIALLSAIVWVAVVWFVLSFQPIMIPKF